MAKLEIDIINLHCAGIDVGSRSHFVAVGQGDTDVKEFRVYAEDLESICTHFNTALPTLLWKALAVTGKTSAPQLS